MPPGVHDLAFWQRKKKTPQELIAAGDFKKAIKAFNEEIKKKKATDPILLTQLANAHQQVGNTAEAKKLYVTVGTHYGDRGFFNKSVVAFKKALRITPEDKSILEKLAEYNDQVPKFMLDERFLRQVSGKAAQEVLDHEVPAEADQTPVESDPQPEALPLATPESTEVEPADLEQAESKPADVESTPQAEALPPSDSDTLPTFHFDEMDGMIELDEDKLDSTMDMLDDGSQQFDDDGSGADAKQEDLADGLPMDFGEFQHAAPQPATPQPGTPHPAAPQPAAASAGDSPIKDGQLDQPISRGGMVFKSQVHEAAEVNTAPSGIFDSFDDALDSIFTTGEHSAEDENSISFDQVSAEEHQRHWPLFRTMPSAAFLPFVQALEMRDYAAGEEIVRQGEKGQEMFLISEGEVEVEIIIEGQAQRVAIVGEGDFFGEASLLTGEPRNATVRALKPSNCLVLGRRELERLTREHPTILASIQSIYYTRLQENASLKSEAGS
jgi:tetratricopeptide (TPR) repeat protein